MTSLVTVEQVVDVDVFVVQVTLDPAAIVDALAEVLRIKGGNLVPGYLAVIRHLPADHPEHVHARTELVRLLTDVFTVTLTPGQAEALGGDLYEATTRPEQCAYDEKFSVTRIQGIEMCHVHAAAFDFMVEESAS
jgi:hypothetical protein